MSAHITTKCIDFKPVPGFEDLDGESEVSFDLCEVCTRNIDTCDCPIRDPTTNSAEYRRITRQVSGI